MSLDSDTCGPSAEGGSVFEPSSYACSTTCELLDDAVNTEIGAFHHTLVNQMLPTLQGNESLDEIRSTFWWKGRLCLTLYIVMFVKLLEVVSVERPMDESMYMDARFG